jgi:hypothetical protein
MTPYVVLFAVVMGVLVAGTRLALARPANRLLPAPGNGQAEGNRLATTATAVAAVAIAALVAGVEIAVPQQGALYATVTVITVAIVFFARSVAGRRLTRAAAAAVAAAAGMTWELSANWLTYSIAGSFIAVAVITLVRPRLPFWLAAAAATALAAYDYLQVCVTHATVRVVASAAYAVRGGHATGIPGLIGIPAHAALLSPYAIAVGAGDVALPGILIVIAGRAGKAAGTPRLYAAAVSGYAAGLAACLAAAATTGAALPAMVFLVPAIIIAVAASARLAGAWPALASKDPRSLATAPDDAPQPPGTGRPPSPPGTYPAC